MLARVAKRVSEEARILVTLIGLGLIWIGERLISVYPFDIPTPR